MNWRINKWITIILKIITMKIKILYLNVYQWILKKRYKEDIEFKLLKYIQARIKNELPDYDGTVKQLLGCLLSFLLKWIKFNTSKQPDWDDIHFHHVRPISTYKNNYHYAFHWTNLFAIDKHTNLSIKNARNKFEKEQQLKRINQFLFSHWNQFKWIKLSFNFISIHIFN